MACRVDEGENWIDVFKERQEAKEKANKIADMLCRLCESCDFETIKLIDGAGLDIRDWWEDHKKQDKERIARDLKVVEDAIKDIEKQREQNLNKEIELKAALNKKYDEYALLIKDKERIHNRG
jgi:hypothetical protein